MAQAVGFFTDTTLCIGCKACEVACHQWNALPARHGGAVPLSGLGDDNTVSLSDVDGRHVKFIEPFSPDRAQARGRCPDVDPRALERLERADGGAIVLEALQRRRFRPGGILVGLAAILAGCASPEDGRPRGGGHGGDGGNYVRGAIHVPSKIDGTKSWPYRPRT